MEERDNNSVTAQFGDKVVHELPVSPRLMWWQWIKAYGLFAPALVLSLMRDWVRPPFGWWWALVLGLVGYLLAVRWLVFTQARRQPLALRWVVLGFVGCHALLVGALSGVLWFLTRVSGAGI